jgi:D-glycero-alpha-D-manno-heptose 1-phosphate guanylyltransferase
MTNNHLPFTAMILVGGLGTRLRSVVSDRPKPLAMVGDVPFLQILIDSLVHKGVRDFVLLAGYMSNMIESSIGSRYQRKLNVRFSLEERPLGTGGAVRNAAGFATDPTLLVNGDTFFDADLGKLYDYHKGSKGEVTLSLLEVNDASRYGSVLVDSSGRITGFKEKAEGSSGVGLINGGLSFLSRDFILGLPEGESFSMERDIYPSFVQTGKMFGLMQQAPFFDIGTPESYEAFQRFVNAEE